MPFSLRRRQLSKEPSMNRSLVTGSSVAASALFLLALLRGSTPTSPSAAPATSRSVHHIRSVSESTEKYSQRAIQNRTTEDGPWKASQDRFAGWQKTECPASLQEKTNSLNRGGRSNVVLRIENKSSRKADLKNNLRSKLWCIPKGEEVRALMAILPDPAQTNVQLQFDRMMDGLQLAAESTGYVIDRYWLPWGPPSATEYPDYSSHKAIIQEQQEKQKQPGLLLFRWNGQFGDDQPKTLYIFLVSDTPTRGVNGAQFANAVSHIKVVCGASRNCGQDPIRIVGPTFSGSLASLRQLTEHHNEEFCAYSGTVSSSGAVSNQGLESEAQTLKTECPSAQSATAHARGVSQGGNLQFISFMHYTENALVLLTQWLKNMKETESMFKDQKCDLALFSETSTTYGNAVSQPQENAPCYIVFDYPREISSLRNAYSDQEPAVGASSASRNTGFSYLPFNLADRESNGSDEPPDFSRRQSPLSKEALLMSFAAELRRQHIKYAGIVGSNVLDVLFLASFLRKACPDVRLFVLNSDLLFERDLDNSPYIGTLTLTTYPLIPRNLDWLQDGKDPSKGQALPWRRLPLADQYQEGEYNAALYAIERSLPSSPSWRTSVATLREVRYPFDASSTPYIPGKSAPPLWLTAVGYGGHWPVTLLRPKPRDGNEDSRFTVDPRLTDEDISPAWAAVAAMACLFAMLHILGLAANFWSKIGINIFVLSGSDIERRFLFVNMASATLVTALGMLLVPLVKFRADIKAPLRGVEIFMGALLVFILGVCVLLAIVRWLPQIVHRFTWRTRALTLGTIAAWLLAGIAISYWLKLHADDPSHYGFFFAYRSVHLATGVSPFTPMIPLLAGLYCWALFESWRLKFHDDERPRLLPPETQRTVDVPGGIIEFTVANSVNDFVLRWRYSAALWLVFLLWYFSLHPLHPFQIFEQSTYGLLYGCAFALGVFLMLCSGFRVSQIWSDLKKLLAELDQSRIKPAFDRVREHSWSPIWNSGVTERAWTNIDRCIELMKQVAASKPKPLQGVDKQIRDLETSVNEELISEKQPSPKIQRELQGLLKPAMTNLQQYWSEGSTPIAEASSNDGEKNQLETYSELNKEDGYTRQMKRLEEFVALRYVAFIGGVLYQIRLLIIIVAMLFSLILLALNLYSFQPHQSLIWSFTAMFAVIGFLIVKVLGEVHRDNVLSLITGTKSNELGLDFYLRVAVFGAAPLVTLLATHFPAIGRYLVSFVQPGLEAVK
jgi:hypothetical protein